MKYTFRFTDNANSYSRGYKEDSFFTKEYKLKNDKEALIKVLTIEKVYDEFDRDCEEYNSKSLEELKEIACNIDLGSPIVFWVKNENNEVIFDYGVDEEEFNDEYEEF